MHPARLVVLSLCTLSLVACGGDPKPLALDDYQSRSAVAVCERVWSCCDAETRMRFLMTSGVGPIASEAECVSRYGELLERTFAQVESAVAEGTVAFDGALAARCVERYEQHSCEELAAALGSVDGAPAECASILRGLVGVGEPCSTSVECESQSCDPSAGSCRVMASEGEPCPAGALCEVGTFCDFASDPPVCARSRADGEACTSPLECRSFACESGACAPAAPVCVLE